MRKALYGRLTRPRLEFQPEPRPSRCLHLRKTFPVVFSFLARELKTGPGHFCCLKGQSKFFFSAVRGSPCHIDSNMFGCLPTAVWGSFVCFVWDFTHVPVLSRGHSLSSVHQSLCRIAAVAVVCITRVKAHPIQRNGDV